MKHEQILLTGGSGNLGRAILRSGLFPGAFSPSHEELDITKEESIAKFFSESKPDAVIHCAAMARMMEHEIEPVKALDTNIVGTCNLVKEILRAERSEGRRVRFIYISTDGVYAGIKGDYSEDDPTIPYNRYGWSKLGGECAVNLLSDFCIIRTSFFDPQNIKHNSSATDMYSSRVPIDYLPKAIAFIMNHDFMGTVNIGGERSSEYERYKEFKPSMIPCKREDIVKGITLNLAHDASLDSSLWSDLVLKFRDV